MLVLGNNLYVANGNASSIQVYNATSGGAAVSSFSTGAGSLPYSLALTRIPQLNANVLYVGDVNNAKILTFNAATGTGAAGIQLTGTGTMTVVTDQTVGNVNVNVGGANFVQLTGGSAITRTSTSASSTGRTGSACRPTATCGCPRRPTCPAVRRGTSSGRGS